MGETVRVGGKARGAGEMAVGSFSPSETGLGRDGETI